MAGDPLRVQFMAEHYLEKLPEVYFLKTEVAAGIQDGAERLEEVRKTENVCFRILTEMLALRMKSGGEEMYRALGRELLDLYRRIDSDHEDHGAVLEKLLESGADAV